MTLVATQFATGTVGCGNEPFPGLHAGAWRDGWDDVSRPPKVFLASVSVPHRCEWCSKLVRKMRNQGHDDPPESQSEDEDCGNRHGVSAFLTCGQTPKRGILMA